MDLFEDYFRQSQDIIGDRSQAEEQYDDEVLSHLRKGAGIRKAIEKANKKYPDETLEIDSANIDDIAAHYDYLKEHAEIMKKINQLKKK